MKKSFLILWIALLGTMAAISQTPDATYSEPEFSNEVYQYRKDSVNKLMRLEKGSSKMDSKLKMGGFGGAETGYSLEGETSTVRLVSGNNLSFIFSNGGTENKSSAYMDSVMKANGVDPATMKGMGIGGGDPASSITLYKTTAEKGQRKIFLQKSGGMFGGKKSFSSDKYSFSVKKIREGYWELVIDKTLLKGEYAFTLAAMGVGSADGAIPLFAFAVD